MSAPTPTPTPTPATTPAAADKPLWEKDTWGDETPANASDEEAALDAWAAKADEDIPDTEDVENEVPEVKAQKLPAPPAEKKADKVAKAKPAEKAEAKPAVGELLPEKTPEPEAPKTYKVKLDKEERELDAGKIARAIGATEAELAALPKGAAEKLYQKLWHAEQQQSKGGEAERTWNEFMRRLNADPRGTLDLIGIDTYAFANKTIADSLMERSMTPEQKQLLQERQRREQVEAQLKQQEQAQQSAARAAEEERRGRQFRGDLDAALQTGKFPVDVRLRKRLISLIERDRDDRGIQTFEELARPADMLEALGEELDGDIRLRVEQLGIDKFMEKFPEISAAIGEARVKRYTENRDAQIRNRTPEQPQKAPAKRNGREPAKRPLMRDIMKQF